MFKPELQRRLKQIFGIHVRFDAPNPEAREQDVIFVDIERCKPSVTFGRESAKVEGALRVFSQNQRIPFGFFSKKILHASAELTNDLFFYEFDQCTEIFLNLVEHRVNFVFLYSGQYDPAQGEISSVELTEVGAIGTGDGDIIGTGDNAEGVET